MVDGRPHLFVGDDLDARVAHDALECPFVGLEPIVTKAVIYHRLLLQLRRLCGLGGGRATAEPAKPADGAARGGRKIAGVSLDDDGSGAVLGPEATFAPNVPLAHRRTDVHGLPGWRRRGCRLGHGYRCWPMLLLSQLLPGDSTGAGVHRRPLEVKLLDGLCGVLEPFFVAAV